uniref:serine protease HTRA3-like n=1 Tax=Myxine glutinosa TaxID=7769 RepID=UPI00358F43F1
MKGSSEGAEGSRKTGTAHLNRKDETRKQDTPKEKGVGEASWNEKGEKVQRVSMRSRFNFMADVVERTAPAVVHIEVFQRSQSGDSAIPVSSGSGFLLSPSGLAITNAHLILAATNWAGPGEEQIIRARLRDGHALATSLTQMDARLDIAALHLHSEDSLPYLPLGHSASVRPGEFVLALGSPLALPDTVTAGVVSSVARRGHRLGLRQADLDFIQTDATINFGNSGGPLVNMDGEVIGMNSLKVAAGISFAIPADRIQLFLSHSHRSTREKRGMKEQFIGIRMLTLTPSLWGELSPGSVMPDVNGGVYVHDVIAGSPAHRAGLKAGDVVVLINGKPALSANQLQEAVAASRIIFTQSHTSTLIHLLVLRGPETLAIAVVPFTLP